MTVQIDFDSDGTALDSGEKSGFLILTNIEKGENYGSWPFHVTPEEHYIHGVDSPVWKWQNPGEPLENITLSPSLKLEWDEPNTFHIFIRNGEVEHCSDCQCGCD